MGLFVRREDERTPESVEHGGFALEELRLVRVKGDPHTVTQAISNIGDYSGRDDRNDLIIVSLENVEGRTRCPGFMLNRLKLSSSGSEVLRRQEFADLRMSKAIEGGSHEVDQPAIPIARDENLNRIVRNEAFLQARG